MRVKPSVANQVHLSLNIILFRCKVLLQNVQVCVKLLVLSVLLILRNRPYLFDILRLIEQSEVGWVVFDLVRADVALVVTDVDELDPLGVHVVVRVGLFTVVVASNLGE